VNYDGDCNEIQEGKYNYFQICPCEDYDNLWLSSEEILKKEDKLHFVVNVIRRQKSRKLINPSQRMCQESSLIED